MVAVAALALADRVEVRDAELRGLRCGRTVVAAALALADPHAVMKDPTFERMVAAVALATTAVAAPAVVAIVATAGDDVIIIGGGGDPHPAQWE